MKETSKLRLEIYELDDYANLVDGYNNSMEKIDDYAIATDNRFPVQEQDIADGTVTTQKLDDDSVSTSKIIDGAVTTDKIEDYNVTHIKLAENAVGTENIRNGAIIDENLACNSVGMCQLKDGIITNAKLADSFVFPSVEVEDGSITSAKLAKPCIQNEHLYNQAVGAGKIAAGAVNQNELADYAVIRDKIQDKAVNADKLADEAVTNAKIANNTITAAKIQPQTITGLQIANDAINSNNMAQDSVMTRNLNDKCVTLPKIADEVVAMFGGDTSDIENRLDSVESNITQLGQKDTELQGLIDAINSALFDWSSSSTITTEQMMNGNASSNTIVSGAAYLKKNSPNNMFELAAGIFFATNSGDISVPFHTVNGRKCLKIAENVGTSNATIMFENVGFMDISYTGGGTVYNTMPNLMLYNRTLYITDTQFNNMTTNSQMNRVAIQIPSSTHIITRG